MYNAGQLRELIEIQRPVELGTDAAGNRAIQWVTDYTVHAAARDVSGREYLAAAALQQECVITLTLRYLPELAADMRVMWRGRAYNIEQINHLGYRGDWMTLKVRLIESEARAHG